MDQLNKEAIARLVREGRAAKGYTQQELSEITGISLRSVQRIENAEVQPRMFTIKILAEHLGFSWQVAAGETPGEASPVGAEEVVEEEHILNAPAVLEAPPAEPPAPLRTRRRLNKAQKIILTIVSGILIGLLVLAYVAQSARFPETDFELFLLLGGMVVVYGAVVFRIWR